MSNQNSLGIQLKSFDAAWDALYSGNSKAAVWQEAPIPVIEQTIAKLMAESAITVLDVGTGDGRNLAPMARAGLHCAGLDVSVTALQHAHRKLASLGLAAILIPGDCQALPVAPGTLDAITAFDVFGQLEAPQLFLESAARSLRPGGSLFLNAFTPDDSECGKGERVDNHTYIYRGTLFRFWPRDELLALFDAGWRLETFEEVRWQDPPHGEFRPYHHVHVNHWVIAKRQEGE